MTVYIDGGFEYIYQLDGSGSKDEEYNEIHVMDGRSRVARLKEFGSTWSGSTADAVRYNLEDHLGNAGFTLGDNGSLISREEYFPFGETSFGSHAKKRYRYNGKEKDEESGLYYYGARYYAPWMCRFISLDPLAGEMPFSSPYSYAANNPVVLVDVDGLAPGGGGGKDGKKDASGSESEKNNNVGQGIEYSWGDGRSADGNIKNLDQSEYSTTYSEPNHKEVVLDTVVITDVSITPSRENNWRLRNWATDGNGEYYTATQNGVDFTIYHSFGINHQYHDSYGTETSGDYYYRKTGTEDTWHQFYPKGYGTAAEIQQVVKEFKPLLDVSYDAMEFEVLFLIPEAAVGEALERIALREALSGPLPEVVAKGTEKGLVLLAEETFAQALIKGKEVIEGYAIYGTKGLVGETFIRNIFSINALGSKSLAGFRSLVAALEAEALAAGAKEISIYGCVIVNEGFLNPLIAKRFGYSFQQSGEGVFLQKTLQ